VRCLYPDRRLCPMCSVRTRRIRIDGIRSTASPRPSVTWCWGCSAPMAQELLGAPRLFCTGCRASRDLAGRRAYRQRVAAGAERDGAAS
jgi:hypothetical protein